MAKKKFGKFLALATISAAVATAVSYFLKYKSFHAELDEDFHDFEGDDDSFDGTLPHEGEASTRNYVSLGEKKEESPLMETAESVKEAAGQAMESAAETAKDAAETVKETLSGAAETVKEAAHTMATTIEEDNPAD